MDESNPLVEVEPLFISLDNKESSYEKVDMLEKTVFYPYFQFTSSKTDGVNRANRIRILLQSLDIDMLIKLERALFQDKHDEYGYWTAYSGAGSFIGLGASGLKKLLSEPGNQEVRYVLLRGNDLVYIFSYNKKGEAMADFLLDIYVSNANRSYSDQLKDVSSTLKSCGIIKPGTELAGEAAEYKAVTYSFGGEKTRENCIICSAHKPSPFKEKVRGCTWHSVRFNENTIKEGPRFVLLRNPGTSMGNILDDLSAWLVHRLGGFVMSEELDSNDFCPEASFCIKEMDEYRMWDVVLLSIECETQTKCQDKGFDEFLKSISDKRFSKK